MLRFHLDEHVANAVANGLRLRGIDVTTALDANLLSASDEDHVAFALRERRVIFTNDRDFLRIHHRGLQHAGIAYCSPRARTIGEVVQFLVLMHNCFGPDDMQGRVQYL
jgi:uncharacterized protein with PIN domain